MSKNTLKEFVYQTTFNEENTCDSPVGNCFSSCLATILDYKIEDVPNFASIESSDGTKDGGKMYDLANDWLEPTGIYITEYNKNKHYLFGYTIRIDRLEWKGEVCHHAVVCYDGKEVHNPYPFGPGSYQPRDVKINEVLHYVFVNASKEAIKRNEKRYTSQRIIK